MNTSATLPVDKWLHIQVQEGKYFIIQAIRAASACWTVG